MTAAVPDKAAEFFGGRARLIRIPVHADERGRLVPFGFDQMPFVPGRSFAVAGVPAGAVRGGHAHSSGMQLLYCLQGRIEYLLRYGHEEVSGILEPGAAGLLVGAGVWCRQTYLLEGTVLLAFASEPYDPSSYTKRDG